LDKDITISEKAKKRPKSSGSSRTNSSSSSYQQQAMMRKMMEMNPGVEDLDENGNHKMSRQATLNSAMFVDAVEEAYRDQA
jgi:hypothetical protein